MSTTFECGDNTALVTYMYDECAPGERSAIEAHLAICAACAAELAALSSTSLQLAAWTPPELEFDFRIVAARRSADVLRPARWWQRPMPAWAQAAAAVALFGTGLSLGMLRGAEPVNPAATSNARVATSQTASSEVVARPVSAQANNVQAGVQAGSVSRDDLVALERRLRAEMTALRSAPLPVAVSASTTASDAQVLARVRSLIDESEQRQRRELALRTAEIVRDADAQRQFDMTRIQRVFGQFEGTAGAEIQRQRQDLNNLIRVSQRPQ